MDTADLIIRSAKTFYEKLKRDEHGRYRSWEHCYEKFHDARNDSGANLDYLSLHLAFYLASWGMYRGSSFLLQKDYLVHAPIVQEVLRDRYDPLLDIECADIRREPNLKLLEDLGNAMRSLYREAQVTPTDTLVTKVLMGTLGCVPAYDRYFIAGIKDQSVVGRGGYSYNRKSVAALADFYVENSKALESARSGLMVDGLEYPQMKMLDMGFWQRGFELDPGNIAKEAH